MQQPFAVSLVVDDTVVYSANSYQNLKRTLQLAAEMMDGIPSAWMGIRYRGDLQAELQTDFRGELHEALVHANYKPLAGVRCFPLSIVTELNVCGPLFA
jgi:hypothetical protein